MEETATLWDLSTDEILSMPLVIPEIANPEKLPVVDIFSITPLQEDGEGNSLKDFHREDMAKLKRVIMTRGFQWPFYIFVLPDGSEYLGDGHGRRRLFQQHPPKDTNGKAVKKFPCLKRNAASLQDAAIQLGEITSQYQKTTQEGIDFMHAYYKLPESVTAQSWSFQGVFNGEPLNMDELGTDFSLPDGDKEPFQQMTFTLADEQAEFIKEKIEGIKKSEEFKYMETFGNENGNGNALYLLIHGQG